MKRFILTSIIFLLIISGISAQRESKVYLLTLKEYNNDEASMPYNYILGDSVNMRANPSAGAELESILHIGQRIRILDRTEKEETIRGISAHWYKVRADNLTGWVWGGMIAQLAFGSRTNPDVKFVFGYESTDTYQIRAFKDNTQLDKIVFKSFAWSIDEVKNIGSMGLNVDDIISIGIPCTGGCGCSTGEILIFWNGKKFSHKEELLGMADAWASEWTSMIFPSDMEGIKDTVIKTSNLYVDEISDTEVKKEKITEYYKWDGTTLVRDNSRQTEDITYIINK